MPLFNPNIVLIPDGDEIINDITKEKHTITDTNSVHLGTTIFCTQNTFQLFLEKTNEDHPLYVKKEVESSNLLSKLRRIFTKPS